MIIDDNSYQELVDYIDYLEFKLIQADLDRNFEVAASYAEGMLHAANIAWSIGGKDHPDSIAYDVEKAILDAIPKGN